MPVSLEQFVKELEGTGILAGETIKDFIPPKTSLKDAEELALELVRQKKLTNFQAEQVCIGNAKSLVLGNYILMEKIGTGGLGQVFKARHRRMDRIVAVKLLPSETNNDPDTIARFEREVKVVAKLSHPNIVAAHDADCANSLHFFVMEFVEGSDLSAFVKKNGPLPLEQSLNYILQAARGLEAAHAEGIVHRDIKPANLLLDKKGTVKVLDLGISRLIDNGDGSRQADLTSTGMVLGTPAYMAPEQALDPKTADARADIYALGCSLFYLLTGKSVYEGDSVMKKLVAHREQPIPSLRQIRGDIPEQVETLFRKMVAKKVEDRYQTMKEVIDALQACGSSMELTLNSPLPLVSLADSFDMSQKKMLIDDSSSAPTIPVHAREVTEPPPPKGRGKLFLIGSGIVGALILLSVLVVSLKTKDGTLIITVNEPDAEVQVLNEADGQVKKPLPFETPGFDEWIKKVTALPAEAQVDAVSKRLVELNPGFDRKLTDASGKETPKIVNGVVTEVGFAPDKVTDISPVRALSGLKVLFCCCESEKGDLSNLSPLQGMSLKFLNFARTNVSDLAPLRGMKLTRLNCAGTHVSDLSPLQGMPLVELYCHDTYVSDLSPLRGMSLTRLTVDGTDVADLSALQGMPLETLACHRTEVSDISPLQKTNLSTVNLTPKNITNGMDASLRNKVH